MTTSTTLEFTGTRSRPATSFTVSLPLAQVPTAVLRAVSSSRRFEIVRLDGGSAIVAAAVNGWSWGERIDLAFAHTGNELTVVRVDCTPLSSRNAYTWGRSERDVRALIDLIISSAAGGGLPEWTAEDERARVRQIARPAIIGLAMSSSSLVVLAVAMFVHPWTLPHENFFEFTYPFSFLLGMLPVLGIVISMVGLKLARLGQRGRGVAIAGIVVGCIIPAILLTSAIMGIIGATWLFTQL